MIIIMIAVISPGEKQFIREGCKQDIRYDGRGLFLLSYTSRPHNLHIILCLNARIIVLFFFHNFFEACYDFRGMSIENNIYPHTNGSSRVRIADVVDVICSVKVENYLH